MSQVKFFNSLEEEEAAIKKVEEFYKNKRPTGVVGSKIMIQLYAKDEVDADHMILADGTKSLICKPEKVQPEERYQSPVGMVIALGPTAYVGDKYKDSGPWCKLGDWVVFPRHNGAQIVRCGKAVHYIYCDEILEVVDKPHEVTRF